MIKAGLLPLLLLLPQYSGNCRSFAMHLKFAEIAFCTHAPLGKSCKWSANQHGTTARAFQAAYVYSCSGGGGGTCAFNVNLTY